MSAIIAWFTFIMVKIKVYLMISLIPEIGLFSLSYYVWLSGTGFSATLTPCRHRSASVDRKIRSAPHRRRTGTCRTVCHGYVVVFLHWCFCRSCRCCSDCNYIELLLCLHYLPMDRNRHFTRIIWHIFYRFNCCYCKSCYRTALLSPLMFQWLWYCKLFPSVSLSNSPSYFLSFPLKCSLRLSLYTTNMLL